MIVTILSDSPFIPTGYSDQSKLLADYLVRKGHDVHFLANAYQGTTIYNAKIEDREFNYKIYGMGRQPYFLDLMSSHLKETKSDIFFTLLDTFMLYPNVLNVDFSPSQSIFWYPSDGGGGLPKGCHQILMKYDKPVAMSRFGQKQVKDYYNIKSDYIPHGTDIKLFHKVSQIEKEQLKARYGLQGKFVIGVVARNQPRKFLDRTLKSMLYVKDLIPNAILFLHLDPFDPAAAFDFRSMISRYGLENRVVFSGMSALKGFPRSQMNNVYNIMDCFFLSTSGEGFGIPTIEAMACEVPIVITDYTTSEELVKRHNAGLCIRLAGVEDVETPLEPLTIKYENSDGFSMKKIYAPSTMKQYDDFVVNGTITGSWEVERGLCDVKDAANKIKYLYDNPEIRDQMGRNGRIAVEREYDFETVVGPQWERLMLNLCGKIPK